MTSAAPTPLRETARAPMERFWLAPPSALPTNVGLNRATWDLRYDPPPAFAHSYVFNGNPGSTPAAPEGPLAVPGVYRLAHRSTATGTRRRSTVHADPRSHVSRSALAAQHSLNMPAALGLQATWTDFKPVAELACCGREDRPGRHRI